MGRGVPAGTNKGRNRAFSGLAAELVRDFEIFILFVFSELEKKGGLDSKSIFYIEFGAR